MKKNQEKPPLYDWVMKTPQAGRNFFRLPVCPDCGAQLKYRRALARLPVFSEKCPHCSRIIRYRAGARSLILLAVLLALGCLTNVALYAVAENVVPLVLFTFLLVAAVYFIWPLTLTRCKKKQK